VNEHKHPILSFTGMSGWNSRNGEINKGTTFKIEFDI